LLFDPGMGKTAIVLTYLRAMRMAGLINSALIVAPLRVCDNVWPLEIKEWGFPFSTRFVHGSVAKRRQQLTSPADIHLVNPDGLAWLAQQKLPDWDCLIVDESTQFKTWGAKRTRHLKRLLSRFRYRIILTGTPTPQSLHDLFSQLYIIDQGQRLGKTVGSFRQRWFYRGGYGGYQWKTTPQGEREIPQAIADIVLRADVADHLQLPPLLVNDVRVTLPPTARKRYRQMEDDLFLSLADGELIPKNAGGRYLACRQIANGGVYDDAGGVAEIHTAKVAAVSEIAESLAGKPVLIAYHFRHDLARLRRAFPALPAINGDTSTGESTRLIGKWNAGQLPMLAIQPQALSHGVNMQSGPGRDVIWFGLTDNLENYEQVNKRLHRPGISGSVRVHRLIAKGTVDSHVARLLDRKQSGQVALLKLLKGSRT